MDFQNSVMLVISAVAGLLGMPVVNGLKKLFKVDDMKAFAITTVVSLAFGVGSLFVSKQFVGVELTLPNVIEAAGVAFYFATAVYKALQAKAPKPPMQG